MNNNNDSKPVAPNRKTRKTKCKSSKSDAPFDEKPDKHTDSKDNDRLGNMHPGTEKETKHDFGDVEKSVTNPDVTDQDSSITLSNMKDKFACMHNGDESDNSKSRPENDDLVKKKTCTSDKIVVSIGNTMKSLTEKKSAITTKRTSPKGTNLENSCDLPDGQSHPIDLEHTQEDEDGNKPCDGANNSDDYPENLNPFADLTSEPDDGWQAVDPTGLDDVHTTELGPARTTAKARPSLYPWRPFAGETNQYKSHMIPGRQTFKKRASLYPWRPFGEQEYPDELNPFSESVQNDVNDDHDDRHLNKLLKDDSKHPIKKYQTSAQEVRHGQEGVESKTEDDDVEVMKPKKIGRGKKFLKTVGKKFRKFCNCALRR